MLHQKPPKCFVKYSYKDLIDSYYQFLLKLQDYFHFLRNLKEVIYRSNFNLNIHYDFNKTIIDFLMLRYEYLNHFTMWDRIILHYNDLNTLNFNFKIINLIAYFHHNFNLYNSLICTLKYHHQIFINEYYLLMKNLHFHMYFECLIQMLAEIVVFLHFKSFKCKINFIIDIHLYSSYLNL